MNDIDAVMRGTKQTVGKKRFCVLTIISIAAKWILSKMQLLIGLPRNPEKVIRQHLKIGENLKTCQIKRGEKPITNNNHYFVYSFIGSAVLTLTFIGFHLCVLQYTRNECNYFKLFCATSVRNGVYHTMRSTEYKTISEKTIKIIVLPFLA